MSYILEALRKMERQRRTESEGDSWVRDLSALPEEERTRHRNPGFIVIVASLVFGVCGLLTGVLLYQGNDASERAEPAPARHEQGLQPRPVQTPIQNPSISEDTGPKDTGGTPSTASAPPAPPQGVTLSAVKASLPASLKATAAGKEKVMGTREALPPILPDDVEEAEGMEAAGSARKGLSDKSETGEDAMEGTVVLKKDAPLVPPLSPTASKGSSGDRVIDLTQRYRLTSTGEVNARKYATIERNDYFIGDAFMGMTVSDIHRDRVYLRGKDPSRQYVIIFRYGTR